MRTIAVLVLSVCFFTAVGQIKIDTEKDVDLRKFKTFMVQKGQIIHRSEKARNEKKIYEVLKDAITKELTMRGYTAVEDSAELTVSYVYEERNEAMGGNPGPLGQTPIDNPANIDTNERTTTIDTGILILEIEEVKKKNSLWTANCTISRVQQDFAKTLEATVIAAFKKFPSKNKKR